MPLETQVSLHVFSSDFNNDLRGGQRSQTMHVVIMFLPAGKVDFVHAQMYIVAWEVLYDLLVELLQKGICVLRHRVHDLSRSMVGVVGNIGSS